MPQMSGAMAPVAAAANKPVESPPVSSTTSEPEPSGQAPKPLMDLMSQPIHGLVGNDGGDVDKRRKDLENNVNLFGKGILLGSMRLRHKVMVFSHKLCTHF